MTKLPINLTKSFKRYWKAKGGKPAAKALRKIYHGEHPCGHYVGDLLHRGCGKCNL